MIALVGIACLTWIGITKNCDVSTAIAGIVLAIAGSNATEKVGMNYTAKTTAKKSDD
jgi:hypothetical protein